MITQAVLDMTKLLLLLLITNITLGQGVQSFHDFKTVTLEGEEINLSKYKGKKILIVNTASKCGLTPQYEGLQKLYEKYKGENFIIIGFPANNFAKQEPGSNDEIKEFCTINYGVTFPMMHKISVKGDNMDPIYAWLTSKEENGVANSGVKWNFQKYLIDEEGKWVGVVAPRKSPDSKEIVYWIENGVMNFTDE